MALPSQIAILMVVAAALVVVVRVGLSVRHIASSFCSCFEAHRNSGRDGVQLVREGAERWLLDLSSMLLNCDLVDGYQVTAM